jgi:L-fuconolactonase
MSAPASEREGGAGGAKPPGVMIDSHQHYWRYSPSEYGWIDESMPIIRRDFLPGDARREMDDAGVDRAVAVQARQTLEETRWLLDLADRHHDTIGAVVGWIDLRSDVDGQLASFAGRDTLVGVRHIVQAEPDGFLDDPAFRDGVARLEHHGLAYDILVYARQLPSAVSFARAFPRQRFVLDHLGKPDIRRGALDIWRGHLETLAAMPNVWCKLSGLVTEADWSWWTPAQLRPYLDAALDAFGPSRVMIGSDWPVCLVAASYRDVIALVTDAIVEYSVDERAQMLGGNARAFWRIE